MTNLNTNYEKWRLALAMMAFGILLGIVLTLIVVNIDTYERNREIQKDINVEPNLCNQDILMFDNNNNQHLFKVQCFEVDEYGDIIRIMDYDLNNNTFYLRYQNMEMTSD